MLAASLAALALLVLAGCLSLGPRTLTVRVVEDGRLVAGAKTGLIGTVPLLGERYPVAPSRADADGTFVFEGLSPGVYELSAQHEDFVYEEQEVRVAVGSPELRVVELRRGVRLRGRILDAAGAPMRNVAVWVRAEDGASPAPFRVVATTGDDGAFLTPAVAPAEAFALRVHQFRDGAAFVGRRSAAAPLAGVNEIGDFRLLDTVTELRLDGEPPRSALRVRGAVGDVDFENVSFGSDGVTRVLGLPDGELRWTLYEVRLGVAPNERVLGEGRSDLAGPRREVRLR